MPHKRPGAAAPQNEKAAAAPQNGGTEAVTQNEKAAAAQAQNAAAAVQAQNAAQSGEGVPPRGAQTQRAPQKQKAVQKQKGAVRAFFSYYKPHKKLFALDLCCSFVIAVCNLFYPAIARLIMNDFVPDRAYALIAAWAAALLGIYILKAVLTYVVGYWGHVLGVRIQADMRAQFFAHVERLPFPYFDSTKTGTIMSRIVNDLFETSELAHHGPEDTFMSLISIAGAVVMLCFVNVWLALIVALFVPCMVLFAVKMRGRMHGAFKRSREKIAEVNAGIESSVSGIRVSKAYTAEEAEEEKFARANGEFKRARSAAYRYMGIFQGGMGFLGDLLYLIALVAGGLFFCFDRIGAGDYTAFILYVTMLLTPVRTLVNLFEQIQDGLAGFARFREVLALPAESEPEHPVPVDLLRGDVVFDDVSFSYHNRESGETAVLSHLSFTVKEGSMVAFVGPSGGGKTTVCHLIPRFYEIDGGSISIGGIDIRHVTRRTLRRSVGIVAQDVFLYGGSIRENIAYGRPGASEEEIEQAAKRADIHEFALSLPCGYDTEVGERGVKLSGGQKQRISIARAFLKDPPLLILDEATSALDNFTERQIQSSLAELSKGRTTIVVAHRLTTVQGADEIIVLEGGKIAERGTHAQLLQKGGVYAGMVRRGAPAEG